MSREKVVLAYSGGLDTSVILKYLIVQGYDVLAYIADVGQNEPFDEIAQRAKDTGASAVFVEDLKREFITDYIYPALAGRAIYENRYLLGTSLARPVIAKRQVEIALDNGAQVLSHGATGKGNDQVRFELAFAALAPRMRVYAPWKDPEFLARFQGRIDLINFAKEHNIEIPVTLEKSFSTDENLMHKSYESGILEDPDAVPPKDIFTVCKDAVDAPDKETMIEITFQDGFPTHVKNVSDGTEASDPLDLFLMLNRLGADNGIGRIDIVENRYIGIKSRGIYETPGGTILYQALRDLEGIAMDKEVQRLRDMLAPELAAIIYNGFWFSPEMEFLMPALKKARKLVDGTVRLSLYKGNARSMGRSSPSSLYDKDLSSMDIAGGFDQSDSAGFIRINALRLRAHRVITRSAGR